MPAPGLYRVGWPEEGVRSYSRKVPQQTWIPVDSCGRPGTVTCAYALWWTGCRWMACKRSGVRIPIAPPQFRDIIRNPEPIGSEAWYSSKVPQRQRREAPLPQSGYGPAAGEDCWHGLRRPDAGTASGFVTRQDASPSPPVTLASRQCASPPRSAAAWFCG